MDMVALVEAASRSGDGDYTSRLPPTHLGLELAAATQPARSPLPLLPWQDTSACCLALVKEKLSR